MTPPSRAVEKEPTCTPYSSRELIQEMSSQVGVFWTMRIAANSSQGSS
jgi:hypothetical protein